MKPTLGLVVWDEGSELSPTDLKGSKGLHTQLALTLKRLRGTLARCPPQGSGVLSPTVSLSGWLSCGASMGCVQLWGPHPLEARAVSGDSRRWGGGGGGLPGVEQTVCGAEPSAAVHLATGSCGEWQGGCGGDERERRFLGTQAQAGAPGPHLTSLSSALESLCFSLCGARISSSRKASRQSLQNSGQPCSHCLGTHILYVQACTPGFCELQPQPLPVTPQGCPGQVYLVPTLRLHPDKSLG